MRVHTDGHTHVNAHTHAHTHARTHTHTHAHTHAHAHAITTNLLKYIYTHTCCNTIIYTCFNHRFEAMKVTV